MIDAARTCARGAALALVVSLAATAGATTSDEPADAQATAEASVTRAAEQLADRLSEIHEFDADFTQTVFGARGEVLQRADGRLAIARPEQFRWEIDEPYPQLIVTVGKRIYLYDPDLDQVTIRSLEDALDGTPALILAGDPEQIATDFDIIHERGLDDQFVLVPRDDQSLYGQLRLIFGPKELERIEILDSFGQMTQVSFHNVELNEPIDPARFSFEIPAGAEIIDDVGDVAAQ